MKGKAFGSYLYTKGAEVIGCDVTGWSRIGWESKWKDGKGFALILPQRTGEEMTGL